MRWGRGLGASGAPSSPPPSSSHQHFHIILTPAIAPLALSPCCLSPSCVLSQPPFPALRIYFPFVVCLHAHTHTRTHAHTHAQPYVCKAVKDVIAGVCGCNVAHAAPCRPWPSRCPLSHVALCQCVCSLAADSAFVGAHGRAIAQPSTLSFPKVPTPIFAMPHPPTLRRTLWPRTSWTASSPSSSGL